MHRAYQSILPCHNKLLQKKWDQTYYTEHRRKVRDAGPVVDTTAPRTYMHLHLKLKKLQLEEERLATIERDNRILLEKMSYIMRTRGRIDNRNDYEYRSLNREKRQRELLRITRENQEILQRITAKQAQYDHLKWEQDWQQNLRYMDSISAFPKDWWKTDGQESASGERRSDTARSGDRERRSDTARSGDRGSARGGSSAEEEKKDDEKDSEEEREKEKVEEEEKRKKSADRKEKEKAEKEREEKEEKDKKEKEEKDKKEKEEQERKDKEEQERKEKEEEERKRKEKEEQEQQQEEEDDVADNDADVTVSVQSTKDDTDTDQPTAV